MSRTKITIITYYKITPTPPPQCRLGIAIGRHRILVGGWRRMRRRVGRILQNLHGRGSVAHGKRF